VTTPAYAPAAARNRKPILGVLSYELQGCHAVFEIGSGTGQHAVHFAAALPALHWQTSDLAENHESINTTLAAAGLANVAAPLLFDVRAGLAGHDESYDAVYSANTAHIMSADAVVQMLPLVTALLRAGGLFCYYGPFRRNGKFSSASNAAFDQTLKARDPTMGLRELSWVDELASGQGLRLLRTYAMPANNLMIIWQKESK
jgi:cyclopropane fatty-acyl-phospholipid synthase-like methyltransferase